MIHDEWFLVDRHGGIINVVTGGHLSAETAFAHLHGNALRGERVTRHVTIEQLRAYEMSNND